jgi:hypothetical protein
MARDLSGREKLAASVSDISAAILQIVIRSSLDQSGALAKTASAK